MDSLHGWNGLLLPYGFVALGVLSGLVLGRASFKRALSFPLIAVPVLAVAALLWTALLSWWPAHGWTLAAGVNLKLAISAVFFGLTGALAGKVLAVMPQASSHQRGALLQASLSARSLMPVQGLTIAGAAVQAGDESKHFKVIGTTGTGKSTAIRELLEGALDRGDRAVIADPDGSYLARFYRASRGDVILNPFHRDAARWNLFAEMTTLFDADQLARSLIAEAGGSEGPWRTYARVFLTSLLRQLHRVKHDDVAELHQLLTATSVEDLRDLLADTQAGSYLTQDNGKFFGAVRAVANTHLGALEAIARQSAARSISVREWVRQGRGVLFLPYRANEIAALGSIISTWMRLAIFESMNQREGDQRLWFVVDELDALGQIDGLKDALARLRKFGGRCVLGFQSIAQVSGTYGHAEAQTIVENCGNTLILRCSSSEGGGTARFASQLIGEREVLREHVTRSRGGGLFASPHRSVSKSLQPAIESAVLASEIEQLPDLQGYLKFASSPNWNRVRMALNR